MMTAGDGKEKRNNLGGKAMRLISALPQITENQKGKHQECVSLLFFTFRYSVTLIFHLTH
jgi:hypothetical protein